MAITTLPFFLSLILSFLLLTSAASPPSSSPLPSPPPPQCPFDTSYVRTIPWDTSLCQQSNNMTNCCQTLLSLFGIGVAQHLRRTNLFQLPDANISAACIADFRTNLAAISIDPSLLSLCFKGPNQFVSNASSCAGIVTTADWVQQVGPFTAVDTACRGDLSDYIPCSACFNAGISLTYQLARIMPNSSSKCFQFTCLYAIGKANELGPLDANTARCILALPLKRSAATAKNPNEGNNGRMMLGLVVGGVVALVISAGLITILYRKRKKRKNDEAYHEEFVGSFKSSVLPNSRVKWFQPAELEKATNGFSQRNFLGKGAYGAVYKGVLSDGSSIAVKEMHDPESLRDEDFSNEVEIISKIRHRNLLSLRGCCVTSDVFRGRRKFLVYDYMSNGSLGDHLASDRSRSRLTWPHRKNIILDVAKGLAYLHHGIKPAIYHRDIKANNILLDKEMKAMVADFGLAKQSSEGQSHVTTRVAGTHGYLAPEYALYGQLTEKSDVYSFGVVILEAISGRKVIDSSSSSYILITDWAWMVLKSGKMEDIYDEAIRDEGNREVMKRFVLVGMLCAHVMVGFRPTIADALKMLEGDIDVPDLPERPLPLGHESFRQSAKGS